MSDNINKLTEYFTKFPGIGQRQARRFVYFLLAKDTGFIKELSSLILNAKENTAQCSSCLRFYSAQIRHSMSNNLCSICENPNTDKKILMVVEKDVDLENIKKTEVYNGLFFVLGGTIPILNKNPSEKIRAKELFKRVQDGAKADLKEIILAMSVNPEGENTVLYITKILEPLAQKFQLKISTLGRGLSTGTELEYSDSDTLGNALKNRA
jgi:recombination protein RecR